MWLIGIVIALLALCVGVLQLVRAGPERRRGVAYWASQRRLLSRRAGAATLKVVVNGEEVKDPRSVTVHFVSYGRLDVPSSAYDGGKPVVIDLGVPVVQQLDSSGIAAEDFNVDGSTITIAPHLIKAGAQYQWEVVCDGPPEVTIDPPLIDTDVMDPRRAWIEGGKKGRLYTLGAGALGIGLILVGLINMPTTSRPAGGNDGGGGLLLDPGPDADGRVSVPVFDGWPVWAFVIGALLVFAALLVSAVGSRRKRTAQRLLAAEFEIQVRSGSDFD